MDGNKQVVRVICPHCNKISNAQVVHQRSVNTGEQKKYKGKSNEKKFSNDKKRRY